ncbi:MAG: phosphodiester glycosidase family protein [Anaerolineales bacterium]
MLKLSSKIISALILGLPLIGCGVPTGTEARIPVTTNTPTTFETPAKTQTLAPAVSETPQTVDSGWVFVRSGLERRGITLRNAADEPVEDITILRIDPDGFAFDVAYDRLGKELEAWQSETGAEVIVNGGYFRKEQGEYIPDGLIVAGGETIGESYGDFAGMFAVGESGPELRWLRSIPYNPSEPLRAALQCFPILIKPGGQIGFPAESEDGIRARRTVIGQDRGGRILFLIASQGFFTLRQLSVFLHETDLELDVAMNLDGGPSSGMVIADPLEIIPAEYVLPIVFVIRSK